ncbi:MAG: hypothetical protein RJA36_3459 [Pseudomonadota bacterium]|jgi:hypothetical protein
MKSIKIITALSMAVGLVACGGGGGDSASPQSTSSLTFNLESAYKTLVASGQTVSFKIAASNSCTGSATFTSSPANISTTFEGAAAVSSTTVYNFNYTNCTPATISETTVNYYSTNYLPLGTAAQGGNYLVVNGALNLPASIKVGDAGVLGSMKRYTNSTKSTVNGSTQLSYVVESDTATTALVTIATKAYDASNVLESTQLTKYTIDSSSKLTAQSITIQYANGTNVVLTKS